MKQSILVVSEVFEIHSYRTFPIRNAVLSRNILQKISACQIVDIFIEFVYFQDVILIHFCADFALSCDSVGSQVRRRKQGLEKSVGNTKWERR